MGEGESVRSSVVVHNRDLKSFFVISTREHDKRVLRRCIPRRDLNRDLRSFFGCGLIPVELFPIAFPAHRYVAIVTADLNLGPFFDCLSVFIYSNNHGRFRPALAD